MPLNVRLITPEDLKRYARGRADPEDLADIEAVIREDPRAAELVLEFLTGGDARDVAGDRQPLGRTPRYSEDRPRPDQLQAGSWGRGTPGE